MILHVSPDAPVVLQVGAAAILFTHIGGAAVGLVSGGAAMVLRKGGRLHRLAGNVFFVAMLCMAGVGAAVAPFLPSEQIPNTMAGVFTFYLVATAWVTVRRRSGEIGVFEVGAFLIAVTAAVAGAVLGWVLTHAPQDPHQPPVQVIYVFAAVAALAATCDLRVILRGGISGAPRIARHLWRMGLALFIAAGSFAGQPKAIPHFLRGSPLLLLPMLAVALAMIYWLIRVRLPTRIQRARPNRSVSQAV